MNASTSSKSSMGGGRISYTLGDGLAKEIVFALILCIPEDTLTMHLLWHTLATKSCSVNVSSDSCDGTFPSHFPFARARRGTFPLSSDLWQVIHILSKFSFKTGPSRSLIGCSAYILSCCVTLGVARRFRST